MDEQTIGRYKILEKVGRGGMGILYRGTDPVLDREVAIKVMSADFSDSDEDARGRFFREARAAARLQHRNIVTVFEFAEQDGVPYIVMEFLRGQSLAKRMTAEPPLTLDQTLDIVTQLCTGLQFAHENGVVHRDVKPGNVWLLEDGTVKLLDFGIAKLSASTFTRRGDVLGSACYMAPEQVSGKSVDGRADVFSAGVVLYEMLAHRRPFEADSPTAVLLKIVQEAPVPIDEVMPGLPPTLVKALDKALQKEPDERYQMAGEFGSDLQLIRLALQSSSDTVFSAEFDIRETMVAATRLVDSRAAGMPAAQPGTGRQPRVGTGRQPTAPEPAPAAGGWISRVPRPAVAAGAVVVAAVAIWLAVALLRPSAPAPAVQQGAAQPPPADVPAPTPAATKTAGPVTNRGPIVMHVTSDPPGASIALDGRDTGLMTPADLRFDGDTPKRIRLTKAGYRQHDGRLSARNLETGTYSCTLQSAEMPAVTVSATGGYPFSITDATGEISASAVSHQISVPESRVIRLRAENYLLDYPIKVTPGPDRTMEIRAPELGRVSIRSTMETCRIVLNGFDLGEPPINGQTIAAGTYSVQLKCPDGQTLPRPAITIVAGQTNTVKLQ